MADAKKPAKSGEKKGAEKSATKKVTEVVKSAAKAVKEVAAHPIKALEHPVETAKKVAKEVTAAVEGIGAAASATNGAHETNGHDVRGNKRTLSGVIRSDKMDKTVVVEVVSLRRDPVYGKYLKNRTRYHAHDEKNEFHTGDRVEIQEHRPLSRHKRWIVSRLIERARVE